MKGSRVAIRLRLAAGAGEYAGTGVHLRKTVKKEARHRLGETEFFAPTGTFVAPRGDSDSLATAQLLP